MAVQDEGAILNRHSKENKMFKPTLTAAKKKTIDIPEAKPKATITIQYIKPGIMQNITEASMNLTSKESDNERGMKSEISFNMTQKDRNIVRECMIGWSGFTGETGTKLKFGREALEDMIMESSEFVDFVVEEHKELAKEVEGKEEEATKNS
jgi:hypothetical protein